MTAPPPKIPLSPSNLIHLDQLDNLNKLGSPAPRYNSYPLLPYWKNNLGTEEWLWSCRQSLQKEKPKISLYIHIPFCESLCSFCACNTYIKPKDPRSYSHSVEEDYLDLIHKEFAFYCRKIPEIFQSSLVQLHIGGGTPNFFTPQNLKALLHPILDPFQIPNKHEFSFEADVRHLEEQHLEILYDLGFRQLSFGIEDFDLKVQRTVNPPHTKPQTSIPSM